MPNPHICKIEWNEPATEKELGGVRTQKGRCPDLTCGKKYVRMGYWKKELQWVVDSDPMEET